MTSPQPTSSMEPSDTTELKPTPSWALQSRTAVSSAPLWLMKPTEPGGAIPAANVALSPATGFMTPRQFGPTTRIPAACASASTRRSSSAPASPTSRKPAEMMMTPRTPLAAHSATRPGTLGAGVTMTARSTASGMAARFG